MSDSLDAGDDLTQRMMSASFLVTQAQGQLAGAIENIGMTRKYIGHDPTLDLRMAIEAYARAVARHEMLVILSTQDFFTAMARSAGASGKDP